MVSLLTGRRCSPPPPTSLQGEGGMGGEMGGGMEEAQAVPPAVPPGAPGGLPAAQPDLRTRFLTWLQRMDMAIAKDPQVGVGLGVGVARWGGVGSGLCGQARSWGG